MITEFNYFGDASRRLESSRQELEHSSWMRGFDQNFSRATRRDRDVKCSKIVREVSFAAFPENKDRSHSWKFLRAKKKDRKPKSVTYHFFIKAPKLVKRKIKASVSKQFELQVKLGPKRFPKAVETTVFSILKQLRLGFEAIHSNNLSISLLRRFGFPLKKSPKQVEMCDQMGIHPLQYLFLATTRQSVGVAKKLRMNRLRHEYFAQKAHHSS